jgi:acyl-CoA thioesterase
MSEDPVHVLRMWEDDRASRALGMAAEVIEPRHARVRMTITETMVNGHDIAHGGYIFTLADSTFALVCNGGGAMTVAAGADITFITAARRGDVLVAEGWERAAYGRSGLTDVTVTRESDGAVVAEFRGRSRQIR